MLGTRCNSACDTLADYRTNAPYIGCTVGRVANRIRGATFSLDGAEHHVTCNEPPNHLHGGLTGFHKVRTMEYLQKFLY